MSGLFDGPFVLRHGDVHAVDAGLGMCGADEHLDFGSCAQLVGDVARMAQCQFQVVAGGGGDVAHVVAGYTGGLLPGFEELKNLFGQVGTGVAFEREVEGVLSAPGPESERDEVDAQVELDGVVGGEFVQELIGRNALVQEGDQLVVARIEEGAQPQIGVDTQVEVTDGGYADVVVLCFKGRVQLVALGHLLHKVGGVECGLGRHPGRQHHGEGNARNMFYSVFHCLLALNPLQIF